MAVDHDVGRFQVAMQNTFPMGRGQTGAQLLSYLYAFVVRKSTYLAEQAFQVFAVNELHG